MCHDQRSATLFSELQILSGGVLGKEDFQPAYSLHQAMTSSREVEVEAGIEVERETVAEGEVGGDDPHMEHRL